MPVILQPPAQYIHSPGLLTIRYVDQDDVARECGASNTTQTVAYGSGRGLHVMTSANAELGCVLSMRDGTRIRMVLPTPKSWRGTRGAYRELYVHELGHWNGWAANHPGGTYR